MKKVVFLLAILLVMVGCGGSNDAKNPNKTVKNGLEKIDSQVQYSKK